MRHRHPYPTHGSKKFRGQMKQKLREEVNFWNFLLRLSGSDYRIKVKNHGATGKLRDRRDGRFDEENRAVLKIAREEMCRQLIRKAASD